MPARYRNIARVEKSHGSKGEVVVAPLPGLPLLVYEGLEVALTPPALDRDRFCTVEQVRPDPSGTALVRFSGIHGIGPARAIVGCRVLAAEDSLDLGPLDAAYDDLLGREVVDERYGSLGRIEEIIETPANDVWVVEGGAAGEVLIPKVPAAVDRIPRDGPIATHVMDGIVDPSALEPDAGPAPGADTAGPAGAVAEKDGAA